MIRRKRKATEKFLTKDIADLLANGLDVNAYGRVITFSFGSLHRNTGIDISFTVLLLNLCV